MNGMKKWRIIAGRTAVLLFVLALATCLAGCGRKKKAERVETQPAEASREVMALLDKYQEAQAITRVQQRGHYTTLARLVARGLIGEPLAGAMDGLDDASPFEGYLFADIALNESGLPLDHRRRAGICAFPSPDAERSRSDREEPKHVILALLDSESLEPYLLYAAFSAEEDGPVKQWPSEDALESAYRRLESRAERTLGDEPPTLDDLPIPEL